MQNMHEMDRIGGLQGLPTDRNTLNKIMALHPGLNSQMNNNQHVGGRGALSGSAQTALALTNYQNLLMNSMNSTNNSIQPEGSSPFSTCGQAPSTTTPGSSGTLPGILQNSAISGFSGCQVPQQQQLQLHSLTGNGLLRQSQSLPSQDNQALQQQMIQQFLLDMSKKNNGGAVPQQTPSVQNSGGSISTGGLGFRYSPATNAAANGPGIAQGQPPNRSNSFKAASSKSESQAPVGHIGFGQKASDLGQSLHLPDEMVPDIAHEFTENGFFNNDLDDSMNFSWKA